MIYEAWLEDMEREDAVPVTASNAREAAGQACDYWHARGVWAGEEVPTEITVLVAADGEAGAAVIAVTHDYSINWYARGKP